VPEILQVDLARGFLLLSDLGSTPSFGHARKQALTLKGRGYAPAASALLRDADCGLARRRGHCPPTMQRCLSRDEPVPGSVSSIGICRVRPMPMPGRCWIASRSDWSVAHKHGRRFPVHRDYRSRNLMVTARRRRWV
jgi:hypothetical protein